VDSAALAPRPLAKSALAANGGFNYASRCHRLPSFPCWDLWGRSPCHL